MAWSYRVMELESGRWLCRFGQELIDEHEAMVAAVEHCGHIAFSHAPANLFVHYLRGEVQLIARF